MAGTAKTDNFLLGAATLMLGAQSELYDMLPATHSIGLIKNFQLSADPAFADLTQGSKNTVIFSQLTSFPVKGQTEVFEYTAQNLSYALSLDGSAITADATVAQALTAPIVSGDSVISVADGSVYTADHYVMIQDTTKDDTVLVRKILSIATDDLTLDAAVNSDWATATTTVKQVNKVDIGSQTNQPFLAAVAVGKLANGKPIGIYMPKVRIVKGFNVAFNAEQYSNLPFELELMDLLPTDPFYSTFSDKKSALFTP